MTAAEIAETLINGNISDAREAILSDGDDNCVGSAVLALDVLHELHNCDVSDAHARLRRCLTGGT